MKTRLDYMTPEQLKAEADKLSRLIRSGEATIGQRQRFERVRRLMKK